jgi:hypothetical protein
MALKDLSNQTMIELSGAWLGANRPLLEAMPHVAPLVADLQTAHDGLLAAVTTPPDDGGIGDLTRQMTDLDALHDRLARGIYYLFGALQDLTDDADQKQQYAALTTALFPKGIGIIQASYLDEAGQAALVEASLTSDQKQQLKAIPTPFGSLLAMARAWFKAARELGDTTQKRAAIVQQPKASTATLGQRNTWVKIVKAMLAMIELDAPSDDMRATIEGPLNLALSAATPRKKANPEPDPTPTPAPPVPTPAPVPSPTAAKS